MTKIIFKPYTPDPPGAFGLTITSERTTGTAPAGIQFAAEITGVADTEQARRDYDFVWSFDDPGDFTTLASDMPWGRDANVAYGPDVAHHWDSPGTYTVTCTAFDGSGVVVQTLEITLSAYTGPVHTIGSDGDYADFDTAFAAHKGEALQRYEFKRGESFGRVFAEDSGADVLQFGAYGTGDRPNLERLNILGGAVEASITDIQSIGTYDPANPSTPGNSTGFSVASNEGSQTFRPTGVWAESHKSLARCAAINANGIAFDYDKALNVVLSDCEALGWYDYGSLAGDAGRIAWVGCSLKQKADTQNGAAKDNIWPDHGPVRISRPYGPFVFSNCDFRSRNDWSSSSTSTSFQPWLRWNSAAQNSPLVFDDMRLNVDRCRAEGGTLQIGNPTGSFKNGDFSAVMDRVHHIATDQRSVTVSGGGFTMRNIVHVLANNKTQNSTGFREDKIRDFAASAEWNPPSGSQANTPRVDVYSNAHIDFRTDANSQNRAGDSGPREMAVWASFGFTDEFIGNNYSYAARLTAGSTAEGPLDLSAAWVTSYDGERYQGAGPDAAFAHDGEPATLAQPVTGSPVIGSAVGKVSLRDFNLQRRDQVVAGLTRNTYSRGPFEPALEA